MRVVEIQWFSLFVSLQSSNGDEAAVEPPSEKLLPPFPEFLKVTTVPASGEKSTSANTENSASVIIETPLEAAPVEAHGEPVALSEESHTEEHAPETTENHTETQTSESASEAPTCESAKELFQKGLKASGDLNQASNLDDWVNDEMIKKLKGAIPAAPAVFQEPLNYLLTAAMEFNKDVQSITQNATETLRIITDEDILSDTDLLDAIYTNQAKFNTNAELRNYGCSLIQEGQTATDLYLSQATSCVDQLREALVPGLENINTKLAEYAIAYHKAEYPSAEETENAIKELSEFAEYVKSASALIKSDLNKKGDEFETCTETEALICEDKFKSLFDQLDAKVKETTD